MEERIYVKSTNLGEIYYCSVNEYIDYIMEIIKTTPNDMDLGSKIRMELPIMELSKLL